MTAQELKQILLNASDKSIEVFLPQLNLFMPKYKIDTPQRIGGFVSQVGVESEDLKYTKEIASGNAYEGRKDLGNIYPGDGRKFKGRGLIQVTGRKNYRDCSLALFKDDRLERNPELLSSPSCAVESACWYWDVRNVNSICDKPEDWHKAGVHNYDKITWISVLVNGGLNGITERRENYARARKVLGF